MHARSTMFIAVISLVLAAQVALAPASTKAQDDEGDGAAKSMVEPTPLEADFKGMIGLGLIGAELGFVLPAVAGARDAWVYIVFPLAGAAGGAAGGYFLLEKGDGQPELAVAALTVGMALVIPAMIVTLVATAYEPEASTAARPRALAAPGGLVRVGSSGLALAAPSVSVRSSTTAREALRTGASSSRELSVAVVSGAF